MTVKIALRSVLEIEAKQIRRALRLSWMIPFRNFSWSCLSGAGHKEVTRQAVFWPAGWISSIYFYTPILAFVVFKWCKEFVFPRCAWAAVKHKGWKGHSIHCQKTLACIFALERSPGGDHNADCAPTVPASYKGAHTSKLICLSLHTGPSTSAASLPAFHSVK